MCCTNKLVLPLKRVNLNLNSHLFSCLCIFLPYLSLSIFPPLFFLTSISPSGCTFWGKKPWSRKKKILWQLGTLIGAPVGITLIAGIAVPAMVIGIPVYVGRKVRDRRGRNFGSHISTNTINSKLLVRGAVL